MTGRPPRALVPGERVPMSFRVRPELKQMMDRGAAATGRSVTQEIELRLEQSFREQALVASVDPFIAHAAQELRRLAAGLDAGRIALSGFGLSFEMRCSGSGRGAVSDLVFGRQIVLNLTCFEATEEQAVTESDSRAATQVTHAPADAAAP